ncbi:peptidylprolyl isomerase [Alteripontixanthobacter maritimus]|uniref:peptidylprolyl isomerase n=1 Tax=Alteripontixanthobacter maritimus TaxID=2161824 RepID=UPI001E55D479|nr:peptidylprolyl isomerase [Alteripontixanthobacter maritimus]
MNAPSRICLALAAFGTALSPVALSAQAAQPEPSAQNNQGPQTAQNPLGIPTDVAMFGKTDPNVRTATAVVNGYVITGTDIDQRVALVTAASDAPVPEAEMQRLRMQVLRNLIDETLQIQEAASQEIVPTPAEINQTYARVASQNFGQDMAAMSAYLTSIGSSEAALKRQIEGELAWQRLLRRDIAPFINVSEEEVTELANRLEAARGTDEYRVAEIYLSTTPETEAAVRENAARIIEQLRQGGSFAAYARQFSEASTAAVGGDLDFVRLAQLPSELSTAVSQMQPGQLVGPIAIPGGLSIVYLLDKRQILTADPRDALLSLKQISITFAPDVNEATAAARVEEFTGAINSMRGCGDAERVAATIGASVVTNDQIRARSLPETLQQPLLALQVGQTTPPFGSVADGVRVLMLCGRDDPEATTGVDVEQIMDRLAEERIGKRAQRYLRDLRNDAYIVYN